MTIYENLTFGPRMRGIKNRTQLEELIPGATLVGTSGFGEAVIRHMDD